MNNFVVETQELVVESGTQCHLDNEIRVKKHETLFSVSNEFENLSAIEIPISDLFYIKLEKCRPYAQAMTYSFL